MRRVIAPLFIPILLLPAAIIGLACGGGDSAQPPTSEATPTAAPPSPTLTPTPEAEETLGRYENAELGFAFNYPDQWQTTEEFSFQIAAVEPGELVAAIVVGDPRSEQLHGMVVQVAVNDLETESEISEVILGLDDMFAQVAGFEIRETESAQLVGMQARRLVIDFAFGGTVPSTSEHLIAISPGLTFQLICEAPRERFAEIRIGCRVIIDSFEFTEGQ